MSLTVDELLLQLEATSHSWLHGQPVRPTELALHLEKLMAAANGDAATLRRIEAQVCRTLERLSEARKRLVSEQAAVPGRRRAIRSQACLRAKPSATLRRRA